MPGYTGGTADIDLIRLRRMTSETGSGTYSDTELAAIVARYPLADITGEWPYLTSGSVNTDWTATYDLASAAAEIWEDKAGTVTGHFDFQADGARFDKSQVYDHHMQQARRWRSRRAVGTHELRMYPAATLTQQWIGNLAEDDD